MRSKSKKQLLVALCLLASFVLWTVLVCTVDVQRIGPLDSAVGLASLNGPVRDLVGVRMSLYTLTDWLSLLPLAAVMGFGLLGASQWWRRKDIRRVDPSLLVLGGFYLVVLAVFGLFEVVEINARPVLIQGVLETSYPSSTTMLVLCVMPTAVWQLRSRGCSPWVTGVMTVFTLGMVTGRALSGVHWLTDLVAGALLSGGLVLLYRAVCKQWEK